MRASRLPRHVSRVAPWVIAAIAAAGPAAADDDTKDSQPQQRPEDSQTAIRPTTLPKDTSTKRASFELGGYSDTNHVYVLTPSVSASIENVTAGVSIRGHYLVDVVTAASVDIVSTASRAWQEVRQAGGVEVEVKPHDFGVLISGNTSVEPDYLSLNLAAQVTREFNDKNTVLIFGYGWGHDTAGRHFTPFSVFSRDLEKSSFTGAINQVLGRKTVGGIALDVMIENGDQSKVYRYIPMFAPNVAPNVPLGASIDWVTQNRLPERPLEQLPLNRERFALTAKLAHRFSASTIRLSERLYDDNWDLKASTTDVRWLFDLGRRFTLWPHARFHAQSSVSFWQRAYVSGPAPGWNLPEFRTGDRELGPLWTMTGGGGIKMGLGSAAEPYKLSISLQGDVFYTSYLDDLYLTSRTAVLGTLILESEL